MNNGGAMSLASGDLDGDPVALVLSSDCLSPPSAVAAVVVIALGNTASTKGSVQASSRYRNTDRRKTEHTEETEETTGRNS